MTDDDPNEPVYTLPDAVAALAPSCQHVRTVLREHGPLTQKALISYGIKERTARWAIERLEDRNAIRKRTRTADARQFVYEIRVPED